MAYAMENHEALLHAFQEPSLWELEDEEDELMEFAVLRDNPGKK